MCTGPPPQSTSQDTPSPQRPYQVCFTDEETEAQKPNQDQEEEKGGQRPPHCGRPAWGSPADPRWPSPSSVVNRASAESGGGRRERDRPALRPPGHGTQPPSAELSRGLRRDLPPTHSPSPLSCTLGSSSKSPSDTES